MAIAYALAQGLGRPPELPESMADVQARARLVKAINRPFAGELFLVDDPLLLLQDAAFTTGGSIRAFIDASAPLVPDVPDPLERLKVVLRLWSGCLMAAKVIADETLDGANTIEDRQDHFPAIDAAAQGDRIFEAGVEAAPAFKTEMEQHYSLDGVPEDSPVRRYAD